MFCHGLPSLVHCSIQWGIRESISDKIDSFFEVFEFAAHRKSHSKPSSFKTEKKEREKGGTSSVIIRMTVLLHFKLQFVPYFSKLSHNSVVCLSLDSSLALINRNRSQSFSACLLNSLLSSGTSDKQCWIAFVKLQGF